MKKLRQERHILMSLLTELENLLECFSTKIPPLPGLDFFDSDFCEYAVFLRLPLASLCPSREIKPALQF
jgi:hypothetical protein